MFFLIPGGGFFSFIILFLVIRLVVRSLFGSKHNSSYTHYYYDSTQNQSYNRSSSSSSNGQSSVYQPKKNYYAVLGLTAEATDEEIKKAYRKLILEYHPDTIANKGLNDEFKDFATKRFREIQEAYEEICKLRGIK